MLHKNKVCKILLHFRLKKRKDEISFKTNKVKLKKRM